MAQQVWVEAYKEMAQRIADNAPQIKWIDLWHNQIGFLEDESPFPAPAVFLAFRTLGDPTDLGEHVQQVNFQTDMYLYFETFQDTYHGAYNQSDALDFLNSLNELYSLFHGFSGTNFSEFRRIGQRPVDTGSSGNLYVQSFTGLLHDEVAMRIFEDGKAKEDLTIENDQGPDRSQGSTFYIP